MAQEEQPGAQGQQRLVEPSATGAEIWAPQTCPDHLLPLDWFCASQRRPVCGQCLRQGACQGHRVRPLAQEAADRRNTVVDQCEKLQLQSTAIAKFVSEVLAEKERSVVSEASNAREVLIRRLNLVRSACEGEEQRLLEAAQVEEERAHQSILTQRAHWKEALKKLESLRTYMVAVITSTDDHSLVAEGEIFERDLNAARNKTERSECSAWTAERRMEEAEGILHPQESEKLNFNPQCIQSPLLSRLWALAVLSQTADNIHVDEKTVSPLLTLSEDKKTLTFNPRKVQKQLDGPARFDHWPNALAEECFCAGIHAWRVRVSGSGAYKLGVASAFLQRKGAGPEARLGCNPASWVFSRYDREFQFSHDDTHQAVDLLKCPAEIGVLVDLDAGGLLFYDPESGVILHTHREKFTGPIYPALAVADQSISLM